MAYIKYITRKYSLRDHFLIVQSLYKKNSSIDEIYYNRVIDVCRRGLIDIYVDLEERQKNIFRLKRYAKNKIYLKQKIAQGNRAVASLLNLPNHVLKIKKLEDKQVIEIVKSIKRKIFNFSGFFEFTHYIGQIDFFLLPDQVKLLGRFHNQRKEAFQECFVFLDQLFSKQLVNTKIKNKKLNFLTLEEIVDFFNKKLSVSEVNRRQTARTKGYICFYQYKKEKIITKNIEKEIRKIVRKSEISGVIKGRSVVNGLVRGRVKIITQTTPYKLIPKGKIIVTQMTMPEMELALRWAKAVVTDEGGLLCHAAIFAREFKKITIVGTKYATQVLQDNDFVEVDANKGIVRKLN